MYLITPFANTIQTMKKVIPGSINFPLDNQ